MTNDERIKARIERSKKKRFEKKRQKYIHNDNFYDVINYRNYYSALRKCRKGVGWKGSVQRYVQNAILEINNTIQTLYDGKLPKFTSTKNIVIYERGKKRKIVPVTISDRMTQRVLCDYALTPVICSSLIYDNGASLPGKGVEFSRRRIEKHLRSAMREYENDFYVLSFDFKSYFDSIPHKQCLRVLEKHFTDKHIIELIMGIIRSYAESDICNMEDEDTKNELFQKLNKHELSGICLGSQISQVMALAVPNEFDHYIKDKCRFKYYIRYMDDGIVIAKTKEELQRLYVELDKLAHEMGLIFNKNKSHIIKISKGFTFLKVHYYINKEGKLVKNLVRSGITRMRRKLKKFQGKVQNGKMNLDDVYNSMQSWLAHSEIASSYHTKRRMLGLYDELFGGYKITRKYNKRLRSEPNEILQADKWSKFHWGINIT